MLIHHSGKRWPVGGLFCMAMLMIRNGVVYDKGMESGSGDDVVHVSGNPGVQQFRAAPA